MLVNDIAQRMEQIPLEDTQNNVPTAVIKGLVFSGAYDMTTPFQFKTFEGAQAGRGETDCIVAKQTSFLLCGLI